MKNHVSTTMPLLTCIWSLLITVTKYVMLSFAIISYIKKLKCCIEISWAEAEKNWSKREKNSREWHYIESRILTHTIKISFSLSANPFLLWLTNFLCCTFDQMIDLLMMCLFYCCVDSIGGERCELKFFDYMYTKSKITVPAIILKIENHVWHTFRGLFGQWMAHTKNRFHLCKIQSRPYINCVRLWSWRSKCSKG